MKDAFEASCKGNYYRTTLHVLNSLVVKCSKLTQATPVYRGSARGVMPTSFWEKNEQGVRGGVEAAFMSTTTSRAVAVGYAGGPEASGEGRAPMVLELGQGMIDRGATLEWLSQYPYEAEGAPRHTPQHSASQLKPCSLCIVCLRPQCSSRRSRASSCAARAPRAA